MQNQIRTPPQTFRERIKFLGPSLIVTANIVGAGELIMTTTLGARAGFIALWVIIISCMVKVMVQLEFGKHTIHAGETTLEAFAKLPGPKVGRGHWSIWVWLGIKGIQLVQMGGMIGGVALALNIIFPSLPIMFFVWFVAISTVLLVLNSHYKKVESISVILIAIFSIFTILCVILLQSTSYAISSGDIVEGMSFQLPAAVVGVALGAFGITGVSSDEAISYPYWCLEKGYAKSTGEYDGSDTWVQRAKGWIQVMYLDAFLSMIIYTVTTAAFYLLGAAILHKTGQVPEGYQTIEILSRIYTESVGPWAKYVFLVGAVVVLFSSLFIGAVSNQRMFTDAFAQLGRLNYHNDAQRTRWFRGLAVFLPLAWATLFVTFKAPVFMVLLGGIVLSLLLLLVIFAAIYFRFYRLQKSLRPSFLYDALFVVSCIMIIGFGAQAIVNTFFN